MSYLLHKVGYVFRCYYIGIRRKVGKELGRRESQGISYLPVSIRVSQKVTIKGTMCAFNRSEQQYKRDDLKINIHVVLLLI